MASADCLWGSLAVVFVSDLVATDSAFCWCDALDNSGPFQYSHNISHNVLLLKRSGAVFWLLSSLNFLCGVFLTCTTTCVQALWILFMFGYL